MIGHERRCTLHNIRYSFVACIIVRLAPLGIATMILDEKRLDNGLWVIPVELVAYILVTAAIAFIRTCRIFAITTLTMLALIITNIVGNAGMGRI